MAIQTSVSENEQDWVIRRELQQAVLLYLAENGSAKWGALYGHFYQEKTDEIGSALQHLAQWNHIAVDLDGATNITAAGMGQLKNGK
jgi:hypothetical protein